MGNNGMEKRALVAAVLCLLVLFLYQSFFLKGKKKPPPQQEVPIEQIESERVEEVKEAPLPPERLVHIPSPGKEAEDVEVETNLFTATFTTGGGRLKDWKLKHYRKEVDPNSEPLNLVSTPDDHMLPLNLYFSGLSPEIICEVDKKFLSLEREGEDGRIEFFCTLSELLRIRKEFVFFADIYQAELFVTIENLSESPLRGRLSLEWISQKEQGKKGGFFGSGGAYGYVGPVAMIGEKVETKDLTKNLKETKEYQNVRWAGFEDKYFISALIPRDSPSMGLKVEKISEEKERVVESTALIHPQVVITPQRSIEQRYSLYFGPKDRKLLESLGVGLDKAIDFGWFDSIAKPLISVLNIFYSFTKNYGLAIIILTVGIKLLFYPLTQKSFQSMKEMQKLQPKMTELREKYKDDKEKLNRELMQLYRSNKVNPLGGCLPMVLQVPVFIALYQGLWNSIELRHTPFLWWINDLSAPEDIFSIPLFGFNLPFRVLPLIMGVTMYLQQKMTPTPTMGSSQQAKMMEWMPIFFTFLFWGFPSGLVLYWLVNNVLTIIQQYLIKKKT